MPHIINFSSVIAYDINDSRHAFQSLCNKYAVEHWLIRFCCPTFFSQYKNQAWLGLKYTLNNETIIKPYKLGHINTEEFLDRLSSVFSFLSDENSITTNTNKLVETTVGQVVSIKLGESNKTIIAKALLEQAWSKGVQFPPSSENKLNHLLKLAKEGPIFFIANTNHLDMIRALFLIRRAFPYYNWLSDFDIAPKNIKDNVPIKIGDNLYLCLSYRYGSFKTPNENSPNQVTTPSLLQQTIAYLQSKQAGSFHLNDIVVISQYEKDLIAATDIGIPSLNVRSAKEYFEENNVCKNNFV